MTTDRMIPLNYNAKTGDVFVITAYNEEWEVTNTYPEGLGAIPGPSTRTRYHPDMRYIPNDFSYADLLRWGAQIKE